MPNYKNLHAADGSMLGFYFQIERLLYWLSRLDQDAVVGVEVDDDIVVQLTNGIEIKTIYEQAKHTRGKVAPFSNKSESLWKTLSIWVNAVIDGKIDVDKAVFSPLANVKIPNNRLIISLSKAQKTKPHNIAKCCKELKDTANKLPKSLHSYRDIINNCPDDILISIIDKITIFEDALTDSENNLLKKAIKNNLKIVNSLPFDYIYNSLFGFVSDLLIDKWRKREEGWIKVSTFTEHFIQLVADHKRKSFYEKTVDLLPVTQRQLDENRGKVYVEQLQAIECDEEEILEAINDYIRAASERSRLAKEGDISKTKFELYFSDLESNWKSISRPQFKTCEGKKLEHVGYSVYYETIKYKGKINNYEPEQGYTYKGSYHYLADKVRVGWHPYWEKLLKK